MRTSFIIPTVNRPKELRRLLDSFLQQTKTPDEIIVVEQGSRDVAAVCDAYTQLPITFVFEEKKSLTHARNVGVARSTGDIVGFLDDDIILSPTYVSAITAFFASHKEALGVQGVITNFEEGHTQKVGGNKIVYWLYNVVAKVFLLNNSSSRNTLQWSGRNKYASRVSGVQSCQWLSGIGNYRRSVFDSYRFDEHLTGYAFGEDKLFSYPIFAAHGQVLFVDPAITCRHEYADAGRPEKKRWVDMKIDYTYYLWKTLFAQKGPLAWVAYWWANIGDLLTVCFSALLRQHPWKFFGWHVAGYWRIVWKRKQVYNTITNT